MCERSAMCGATPVVSVSRVEKLEVGTNLDQLYSHLGSNFARTCRYSLVWFRATRIDVESVHQDEMRDLGSILQNGVERVETATEEASDAAALTIAC